MKPTYVLFTGERGKEHEVAWAKSDGLVIGEMYQVTATIHSAYSDFYELAGFRNKYGAHMFHVDTTYRLQEINDALRNPSKRVDEWDAAAKVWQPYPASYMALYPVHGNVRIVDINADVACDDDAHNIRISKTSGVRPHDILVLPRDNIVRLIWTFAARGIRQTVDADYKDGLLSKVTHSIFTQIREGEDQELVPYNIQIEYGAPEAEGTPLVAKDVDLDRFSRILGLREHRVTLHMIEGEYLLPVPRGRDHDLVALKPSIRAK